jgi:hypothetical protein
MKTDNEIVRERLIATGIYCFIMYFEVFHDNCLQRSNENIIEAFRKNHENWTMNSFQTRASKGKSIFKDGLEKLALDYIVNSANENKINYAISQKAKRLLINAFRK